MKRDTPRGRPNSPRRPRVAPDLVRYLSLLAGREPAGGLLEVRYRSAAGVRMRQQWFPAGRPAPAARRIVELADHADVYVGVAPRCHRRGGRAAIQRLWVLWADVDDPAARGLADQLPIPPGMIVNSGIIRSRLLWRPSRRAPRRWRHVANARDVVDTRDAGTTYDINDLSSVAAGASASDVGRGKWRR